MIDHRERPHFPGTAPIEAYGNGGFRFADLSHRGSILCLPSGIYAWAPLNLADVTAETLKPVMRECGPSLRFFLIGTGVNLLRLPERLTYFLQGSGLSIDTMASGAAARTYNIMIGEGRPVGAALIAVP